MPCGPDVEKLAAGGDLPRHVQPAGRGNVDADEVDQPFGYQENPFVAIDEKLAHGDRATGLLPQRFKPGDILGREGILHEERAVGLDRLAELNGLVRRDTFVYVMQELHIESQLGPQLIEHLDRVVDVWRGLEHRRGRNAHGPHLQHLRRGGRLYAVTGETGYRQLYPDITITLRHPFAHLVFEFGKLARGSVTVQ